MKRRDFVRGLERSGCVLKRRGGRPDIFENASTKRTVPVPRHNEIPDSLCKLIRRQLGIEDGS